MKGTAKSPISRDTLKNKKEQALTKKTGMTYHDRHDAEIVLVRFGPWQKPGGSMRITNNN